MIYLFDIDGTLLLTGGAGSRALDRVFRASYGIEGAMDGIRLAGKTDPVIVEEVFVTQLGRTPSPEEIDQVIERYVPLLQHELGQSPAFRLMPNVVETLDFLATQAGILLGIATGNVRAAADAKLDRAALRERFAMGGYGCDHRDRARLVARAIERARALDGGRGGRLSAVQVVVVGDTPSDVSAARAVGAQVLAVATGSYSVADLAACGPDQVFETLDELPAWHHARTGY